MSLQRKSKWLQRHKPIVYKFEEQAEETRKQNAEYWDQLSLPRRKAIVKTQQQRNRDKQRQYKLACKEVDERDNRTCQFPGCNCRTIQHHHAKFKSCGGKDRVEEIVSLCYTHHQGDDSPHQSEEWRKYWENWLEERYPSYWREIREGQKIQQCNNTAIGG